MTNDELNVAIQKVFLLITFCDAQETVVPRAHENRSEHNREVVEAHFCHSLKRRDLFQVSVFADGTVNQSEVSPLFLMSG